MKGIRKLIAVVMTMTCTIPYIPSKAEETAELFSSKYVNNAEGNFTIASAGKAASIQIDTNDFGGVVRAANDLAEDIERVTGSSTDIIENGFIWSDDRLLLKHEEEKDATAFLAVYDSEHCLKRVNTAEDYSNGYYSVPAVSLPEDGESMKAFLWDSSMKPLESAAEVTPKSGNIVVGTIGHSDLIDRLINENKIDVSEIKDKRECFITAVADNNLVIAGSDKRGTIYGIYDLSENIGISPWNWWADVPARKSDNLYVSLEQPHISKEPSVEYRGIFINDEWCLNQWSKSIGDGSAMNTETYEKIFELLLRLKANYLWPAMHEYSPAFNLNSENAKMADYYGIVMGSSHCEMLLRNNVGEWEDYYNTWKSEHPDVQLYGNTAAAAYDYRDNNKQLIQDYWRERIETNHGYDNTYTIGMRGVHDGAWAPTGATSTEDKISLMSEIIEEQRKILSEESGKDAAEIPQVFILYKEIGELYNAGLNRIIPDDVTLMWTDDNFGNIRQTPNDDEKVRSGGNGVYYHLSYYGYPKSYLWSSSNSIGQIKEEMTKAYDCGIRKIWIANVGDIKPAEKEIEYFLNMAYDMESAKETDICDYLTHIAKRDYHMDESAAKETAEILKEYYSLTAARRPEHFESGLMSVEKNGDEAEAYLMRYSDAASRAEKLYFELPDEIKPAFFEMVLYPIRASKNHIKKYVYADKANLYNDEKRGQVVNRMAAYSAEAYNDFCADTDLYNSLLDGKWNKIMQPFQTKLNTYGGGTISKALSVPKVYTVGDAELNAVPESLNFSRYPGDVRYMDIYNSGYGSINWKISSEADYVQFSKSEDTVNDQDRIYIGIDYDNAPEQILSTDIILRSYDENGDVSGELKYPITIDNEKYALGEKTYVENDATISIEAEHYSRNSKTDTQEWKIEKDYGRSGGSIKVYPDMSKAVENPNADNSAYTEYDIYFKNTGTYNVNIHRMPTLDEKNKTVRFAVGMDDEEPTLMSGCSTYTGKSNDEWANQVLNNAQVMQTTITVNETGIHTLKLYAVDPSISNDKIILTQKEDDGSYFGAAESYNTSYNAEAPKLPGYAPAPESTGEAQYLDSSLYVAATINADEYTSLNGKKSEMQTVSDKFVFNVENELLGIQNGSSAGDLQCLTWIGNGFDTASDAGSAEYRTELNSEGKYTAYLIGITNQERDFSIRVNNSEIYEGPSSGRLSVSNEVSGKRLYLYAIRNVYFERGENIVDVSCTDGFAPDFIQMILVPEDIHSPAAIKAAGIEMYRHVKLSNKGSQTDESSDSVLEDKNVYAFGDSIVYGHNKPEQSFMKLIASDYNMNLTMYAVNGASVVCTDSAAKEDPSELTKGNYIINQINSAPSEAPDVIVFDGYTNDAYGDPSEDSFNSDGAHINIMDNLGTIQGSEAETFDVTTYCGGFEQIIYSMRKKWPDTPIIFVTIHKSGARDFEVQSKLRELSLEICDSWNVSVADVYNDTTLDTRDAEQMSQYIINGAGSHPNETACREFYMPVVVNKLESAFDGE